jgi:hypothetical protein
MAFFGFALIGYPIKYEAKLPFAIDKNLRVERPSEYQLKRIRKYLQGLSSYEEFETPFERRISKKREKDIGGEEVYFITSKPLKKEDWLYSVVKFKAENNSLDIPSKEIFDLKVTALLCEKKFMILHSFHNRSYWGWGSKIEAIEHLSEIRSEEQNYIWNENDLVTLKALYLRVSRVHSEFPDLYHSLRLYKTIPKIAGYNELMCLALFSVIESVLTHSPKSDADSITHQIRTKVKLLSNRFDKEIDYSSFSNVPIDTLWKKLYEFRSRIAHGGRIDFSKDLKILKDSLDVQVFLDNFTKTLLRNALFESQLYHDLKQC